MPRSLKALLNFAAGVLLAIQMPLAQATVVMELSFEELVAQSALIFTGNVLAVDISVEDKLVYSTVTFAVAATVKGELPEPVTDWSAGETDNAEIAASDAAASTRIGDAETATAGNTDLGSTASASSNAQAAAAQIVQLRFLGGEAPGLKVEVAGQQIPQPGDRGLFFISDPYNHQVNPLTGWSQGWFPLLDADDGQTYLDLRNHQDYALVLGYPDPLARKMQAVGFSLAQIEARVPGSLEFPLADFIAAITQIVEQQAE